MIRSLVHAIASAVERATRTSRTLVRPDAPAWLVRVAAKYSPEALATTHYARALAVIDAAQRLHDSCVGHMSSSKLDRLAETLDELSQDEGTR